MELRIRWTLEGSDWYELNKGILAYRTHKNRMSPTRKPSKLFNKKLSESQDLLK